MTSFVERMSGPSILAAVLLAALPFGCGHAHTVGDTGAAAPSDPASSQRAERKRGEGAGRAEETAAGPIKSDGRAGAPPLATSPAGLLKPDAMEVVQKKLVSSGDLSQGDESGKLDEATRAALRGFQRKNNLPATGAPDDLTVQKLGLRPDQLFRAAPKGDGGAP